MNNEKKEHEKVCLKIIKRKPLITPVSKLSPTIEENNELISIFVKSIETAKKNRKKEKMQIFCYIITDSHYFIILNSLFCIHYCNK